MAQIISGQLPFSAARLRAQGIMGIEGFKKKRKKKIFSATFFCGLPHLHQLHEVLEVLLLVNGELAVVVDDAVVLHLAVAADAQGVVAGVVGAFPHQEQTRFRRVKESLGLLPSYLPMKPAGRREEKEGRGEEKRAIKER